MGRFEEDISLLDVCPFSLGISIHNDKENDNSYILYIIFII